MKTFLDTGVLISAWQGDRKDSAAAMSVIADESRTLLTCDLLKLEILPKPLFFKMEDEVNFYTEIFKRCASLPVSAKLYTAAFALAQGHGLSAGDAFNLAAAIEMGADEFVTSEAGSKPMFRIRQLRVTSLHAARYIRIRKFVPRKPSSSIGSPNALKTEFNR